MKTKITLLGLFLLIGFNSIAQERSCVMQAHMQEKLQNPEFREKYKLRQEKFHKEMVELRNSRNKRQRETVTIPVAVHFPAGNESNRTCLEVLAQSQIDILNNDFKATNSDISNWTTASSQYPAINTGVIDVVFIIATKNHPADTDTDLVEGGKAVTIGYNFGNGGDSDVKWAGYMNFVIKDISALGYSSLGGDPSIGDTVVMDIGAFGSGNGCTGYVPQTPYHLGRTVTHELGHHYNLDHTWGNGGCASDDDVADTPNIDSSSGGCPSAGSVIMCGNKSLTMNYMDYVNDACMYMFTAGQAQRAIAYINTIKDQYKTDVFTTLTSDDLTLENAFVVYPNPTNNELFIELKGINNRDVVKIELFDVLGRSVKNIESNVNVKRRIDMHNLKEGLYLLRVKSGKNATTKKIVVRH